MKSLRICANGHKYFKTSDCPVCPVCEGKREPHASFMIQLAAPARRALENAGIDTLNKLSLYSEKEILKLHGIGKTAIPKLKEALLTKGLTFNE
ncbi:hypothetical protein Pedsa_0840 [Pseudopedobacter saltans DSM 12145]|uniref:Uncharacterized protein n=1 Tax=Pseudopedobacter saltans (strain ATCC 51119 / DSM 12145 / JCM 21818 / CCUG 39354 / LMG 10337 / NBRC 100064 / NCIMB 13643) TaxID=762903 RepID=F0S9Q6_PSESL|nr:DNA-directed RNA polymerase subunit alpha C-terminal domain-containing protein [Pseudopedobacter saltans]ADY51412.1 hypothetical protein Pedsa_0840 [Pseudopedobacter saltans DSM 12145]